ncbi:MAG: hypothetical protein JXA54_15670 [Candidatus Heimdallarchaeota archaeon]|nr:hypothetical protein [Candidatus Heimdallarchaeota archaeon]
MSEQNEQIKKIVDAANRLGVEIDEEEALKWIDDMKKISMEEDDYSINEQGIYGHKISLIDFDSKDLERYKKIADVVGLPDTKGVVETAISLSGSAAQGKIQRFPGDLDFFERVNIISNTKEEACKIIGEVMRTKALERFYSPGYNFIEAKWGTWQNNVTKSGKTIKVGSPISWTAQDVKEGFMIVKDDSGKDLKIQWNYGETDPGWCKLDWIFADVEKGIVFNVSNMLDVTWEGPDGTIVPLDGQLDPYYQEIYLEAESIPLFTKLREHLTPDKLDNYVHELEKEVKKYTKEGNENYGKVAKRLYNIFRLTGAHIEAMFIRELFDESASALYQVWALIDTLDEAGDESSHLDKKAVAKQASELIKLVIKVCEGEEEEKIVDALMRLRDDITGVADLSSDEWDTIISESRFLVIKLVNEFFHSKLVVLPKIADYLEKLNK